MRYVTNAKTYLKILSGLLALFLAATSLACQIKGDEVQKTESVRNPPPARLYPVYVDGRYGFIDEGGNLKFTLSEDVYTVGNFSEGLVVVARRVPNTYGRWGFVDESGKVVIESRFNLAKPFSEGLAAIVVSDHESTSGQVGFIDHYQARLSTRRRDCFVLRPLGIALDCSPVLRRFCCKVSVQ